MPPLPRCYWCAYELDVRVQDSKSGLTPFSLNLPYNVKGTWCNGSCAESWFRLYRPKMTTDNYRTPVRDALHHHKGIGYNCAPEPFEFSWFQGDGEEYKGGVIYRDRPEYLSKCTYYDSVRNVTMRKDVPEAVSFNLLDLAWMTSPDQTPKQILGKRIAPSQDKPVVKERDERLDGDDEKVKVVAEIPPKRKKSRRSKTSHSNK